MSFINTTTNLGLELPEKTKEKRFEWIHSYNRNIIVTNLYLNHIRSRNVILDGCGVSIFSSTVIRVASGSVSFNGIKKPIKIDQQDVLSGIKENLTYIVYVDNEGSLFTDSISLDNLDDYVINADRIYLGILYEKLIDATTKSWTVISNKLRYNNSQYLSADQINITGQPNKNALVINDSFGNKKIAVGAVANEIEVNEIGGLTSDVVTVSSASHNILVNKIKPTTNRFKINNIDAASDSTTLIVGGVYEKKVSASINTEHPISTDSILEESTNSGVTVFNTKFKSGDVYQGTDKYERTSGRNSPGGYAGLDKSGKIRANAKSRNLKTPSDILGAVGLIKSFNGSKNKDGVYQKTINLNDTNYSGNFVGAYYAASTRAWITKAAKPDSFNYFGSGNLNGWFYTFKGAWGLTVPPANYAYDLVLNSWSTKFTTSSDQEFSGFSNDNKYTGYVLGGVSYSGGSEISTVSKIDILLDVDINIGSLSSPRRFSKCIYNSGEIITIGGIASTVYIQSTYRYNTLTESETTLSSTISLTGVVNVADNIDSYIYAAASANGVGTASDIGEKYNPISNTWAASVNYPITVFGSHHGKQINSIISSGGNNGGGSTTGGAYKFNLLSSVYSSMPSFLTRDTGSASQIGNGIFLSSGTDGSSYTTDTGFLEVIPYYKLGALLDSYDLPESISIHTSSSYYNGKLPFKIKNGTTERIGYTEDTNSFLRYGETLADVFTTKTDKDKYKAEISIGLPAPQMIAGGTKYYVADTGMPDANYGPGAHAIGDYIYSHGGINNSLIYNDDTIIYNNTTNQWTFAASSGVNVRSHSSGIIEGKLMIAAGFNGAYLSSSRLYNPISDSYVSVGGYPSASRWHASISSNGFIFSAGGYLAGATYTGGTTLYNPVLGGWVGAGTLTTARYGSGNAVELDGRIGVISGTNGSSISNSELYNQITTTYSVVTNLHGIASNQHTIAQTHNRDTYYKFSGLDAGFLSYEYNYISNTTSSIENYPLSIREAEGTQLSNDIVIIGGYNGVTVFNNMYRLKNFPILQNHFLTTTMYTDSGE